MNRPLSHPTVPAVKAIHAEVLKAHGGLAGVRDEALLESAVAAPQATMSGKPLFTKPVEIAAAYLFYLCRNHPFNDGNKRMALATCLAPAGKTERRRLGGLRLGCRRQPPRPRTNHQAPAKAPSFALTRLK
jgi:hypothetical protein